MNSSMTDELELKTQSGHRILPRDRTILEHEVMEFRPFGLDEQGHTIRDLSRMSIRAIVVYLEKWQGGEWGASVESQAEEELCRLLNQRIKDPVYHGMPEFLKNAGNSYSYEFTAYRYLVSLVPPVALFPHVSPALGGFVQAWNAGAYPAEDFIGDRTHPVGHFISPDRFLPLVTDQRDGFPHVYRCEVGDIDHDHIHAYQADDRSAASLNQDRSAMGEQPTIAVGIANRQHRDTGWSLCDKCPVVADRSSVWNAPKLDDRTS